MSASASLSAMFSGDFSSPMAWSCSITPIRCSNKQLNASFPFPTKCQRTQDDLNTGGGVSQEQNSTTGPLSPWYRPSLSTKTTSSGASTATDCHGRLMPKASNAVERSALNNDRPHDNRMTVVSITKKAGAPRYPESHCVPSRTRSSWLPGAGGKGIRTPDLWLAKPPL